MAIPNYKFFDPSLKNGGGSSSFQSNIKKGRGRIKIKSKLHKIFGPFRPFQFNVGPNPRLKKGGGFNHIFSAQQHQ